MKMPSSQARARVSCGPQAPSLPLLGRNAVVTGSTRGLGSAIALALAAAGANVCVNGRGEDGLTCTTISEIERIGRRALYVAADVSAEDQVRELFATGASELGPIGILVNNVGVVVKNALVDMSAAEWDRILAVNLRSMFLCCRAVLPGMLERGSGKIVNVASQLAYRGEVGSTAYSASKGGVLSLTRALAREVGPRGVNVNAVAPGPVLTDALTPLITREFVARKLAGVVEQRFAEAEDIAPTVVFLCSEASTFYHGQTLSPNGGGVMA